MRNRHEGGPPTRERQGNDQGTGGGAARRSPPNLPVAVIGAGPVGLAAAAHLLARGREAADRIRYGMPDVLGGERARYAGRRVLVLGGGDSATGVLLDLAELAEREPGTRVVWARRGRDLARSFGGGAADQLPQRGM